MKKLRFAGRTLRLYEDDANDLRLEREGRMGDSDIAQGTISVRQNVPADVRDEIIVHELLHHVWHLTPLATLLEDHEETVIRSLSPWLVAVGFRPPKFDSQ